MKACPQGKSFCAPVLHWARSTVGSNITMCVLAGGSDGYQAEFASAEFEPGFTDQLILVADRRDGQPLNSREGPLRLIVPSDKRPARWVWALNTLRLKRAR